MIVLLLWFENNVSFSQTIKEVKKKSQLNRGFDQINDHSLFMKYILCITKKLQQFIF